MPMIEEFPGIAESRPESPIMESLYPHAGRRFGRDAALLLDSPTGSSQPDQANRIKHVSSSTLFDDRGRRAGSAAGNAWLRRIDRPGSATGHALGPVGTLADVQRHVRPPSRLMSRWTRLGLGGRDGDRYLRPRWTVSIRSGERRASALSRCASPTPPCPRPGSHPCRCPSWRMKTASAFPVEHRTEVHTDDAPQQQSAHQRRPPVGEHHGDGEDRGASRGRVRPARADRRRQARARSVRLLVRAGGLHGHRGRDGQHVRPPPGAQPRAAAGGGREPSRHAASRRQVRRDFRGAGRAGGGAYPQRCGEGDGSADRGHQLDQRGRLALRPGDDRLGGVRGAVRPGLRLRASQPRGRHPRRRARAYRLQGGRALR